MIPTISTNWLDKTAMAISPSWGVSRMKSKLQAAAFSANGFVTPGSARKSMKGVTATANSPDADTIDKLPGTRALSRDLVMTSPLAASIVRRHKILSIGSGLQVQSIIDSDFLGINPDEAKGYTDNFEREFDLWAESFNSDFDGINYYGDNQALGYLNMLVSGDFFYMPVWRPAPEKDFPYELTIKLIDADLVRTPLGHEYSQLDIKGGVEKDSKGTVVAYYVWDTYPNEFTSRGDVGTATRVPVFTASGRRQIYHVFDPERISQRRGIGLLANCADALKQATRLSEAQVMSALLASYFTVFIKDISGFNPMLGQGMTPEETVTGGGRYDPNSPEVEPKHPEDGNDLEMGHGNVTYLDGDKEVQIADPGKSDKDFNSFWSSLANQIAGASNIPLEQALGQYTTSYTAARAAANDVWQYRLTARTLINRKMNQPIYVEWMSEAVIKHRVQAPGFFNSYAMKRAWSRAAWVGMGRGSLDPLREAKGSVLELNNFLTTHEEEYVAKHGGRWDTAMVKRASEDKTLERLNLSNKPDPAEIVGPDGQEDEEDADPKN